MRSISTALPFRITKHKHGTNVPGSRTIRAETWPGNNEAACGAHRKRCLPLSLSDTPPRVEQKTKIIDFPVVFPKVCPTKIRKYLVGKLLQSSSAQNHIMIHGQRAIRDFIRHKRCLHRIRSHKKNTVPTRNTTNHEYNLYRFDAKTNTACTVHPSLSAPRTIVEATQAGLHVCVSLQASLSHGQGATISNHEPSGESGRRKRRTSAIRRGSTCYIK